MVHKNAPMLKVNIIATGTRKSRTAANDCLIQQSVSPFKKEIVTSVQHTMDKFQCLAKF